MAGQGKPTEGKESQVQAQDQRDPLIHHSGVS